MDGLKLLRDARAAGLTVFARGDRLVVRGPRSAGALARCLLDHKAEVLAALEGAACPACGGPAEHPDRLWLDANALREAWKGALWELGEAAGWPGVPLPPPRSVAPGEIAWRRFMDRAPIYDLERAAVALRERLGSLPTPAGGEIR